MEALLVASGVLLAAQYKRNPTQFQFPSGYFRLRQQGQEEDDTELDEFGCDANKEYTDRSDPCYKDQNGCRVNQTYLDPQNPCWDKDTRRTNALAENDEPTGQRSGVPLGPGEYNFYPDDFFYNRTPHRWPNYPSTPHPNPPTIPGTRPLVGGGVLNGNPVLTDMMNDIRTGNNRIPASTAIASAYRPSWVRNVVDNDPSPRQERERELFTETPREAQIHTLPTVTQRYGQHGADTLNHFGKGGLPFDEQIRVRPDGLDPDPTRRLPTARFNTYALGDDLTQSMADYGKIRGLAQGQRVEGLAFRQEGWDVMPDRDIQLSPSNVPIPLSGAGVRSGGRGASLGSFLGSSLPAKPAIRQGIEWDHGPTANKGPVPKLPVRPSDDDPLDKRFVIEDIDPTRVQQGTARKPELPKGSTSTVAEKGAWKFSFDLKTLFDMNLPPITENRDDIVQTDTDPRKIIYELNANKQVQRLELPAKAAQNDRLETTQEKIVALSDQSRNFVQKNTADSKRLNLNIQPKAKNTAAFAATKFVPETMAKDTKISSSDIKVAKNIATAQSAPLGKDASGRRVAIAKSDAPIKLNAINDVPSLDNDKIFERGGTLREPMAAPKTETPDYAQTKINAARNGREFRRR